MVETEEHSHDLAEDYLQIFLGFCEGFNEDYLLESVDFCSPERVFYFAADIPKRSLYLFLVLLDPYLVSIAIHLFLWHLRCDGTHGGKIVIEDKANLEAGGSVGWTSLVEDEGFPLAKSKGLGFLAAAESHSNNTMTILAN